MSAVLCFRHTLNIDKVTKHDQIYNNENDKIIFSNVLLIEFEVFLYRLK